MCAIGGDPQAGGQGNNPVVRTLVERVRGGKSPYAARGASQGRAAQGRNTTGTAAASMGGVPTILTSGSGVASMAPTANKTLLGG